jgi:hypothetical protein
MLSALHLLHLQSIIDNKITIVIRHRRRRAHIEVPRRHEIRRRYKVRGKARGNVRYSVINNSTEGLHHPARLHATMSRQLLIHPDIILIENIVEIIAAGEVTSSGEIAGQING